MSIGSPASAAARCGETAGPKRSGATSSGSIPAASAKQLVVGWPVAGRLGKSGDNGLVSTHLLAGVSHRRKQRGAHDRLADAGAGAGYEQPTHGVQR